MLKEQQCNKIIRIIAIQTIIAVLAHRIDQYQLEKQIKQWVYSKFHIQSRHYWRSISSLLKVINDTKWKVQDRSQIVSHFEKIQPNMRNYPYFDISSQLQFFGYYLLLQITNLLKQAHLLYFRSISLLLLLKNSSCLEKEFRIYCHSKICQMYPDEITQLFNSAKELYLSKQLDQAKYAAQTGINICKKLAIPAFQQIHAELHFLNANILSCKRKMKISCEEYIEAVRINKSHFTFRVTAILSCLINQKYRYAQQLIDKYNNQHPDTIELMGILVAVLALQQNHSLAREKYDKLEEIAKGNPLIKSRIINYHLSMGIFHFKMIEYQLCYQSLLNALRENGCNLYLFKWMAACCFRLQRYQQSLRFYYQMQKLPMNDEQRYANTIQIGLNYLALLPKYPAYKILLNRIVSKIQNYYKYMNISSQSIILLQLYCALNQFSNMMKILNKYQQISPILSLQDSRANICLLKQYRSMYLIQEEMLKQVQIYQFVCFNKEGDIYEQFQQGCFLIEFLLPIYEGRKKVLQQKVEQIIRDVEKFSLQGAKHLREQLNKRNFTKYFQLTTYIK